MLEDPDQVMSEKKEKSLLVSVYILKRLNLLLCGASRNKKALGKN